LWRKDIPLKVDVFTWRLFRFRLPTKSNLCCRGVIPSAAQMCVAGCGFQETENHPFLAYPLFGQIWKLVRNWLCVYSADYFILLIIFISLVQFLGVLSPGALSCICFGLLVFGWFGRKETTWFLAVKRTIHYSSWKK